MNLKITHENLTGTPNPHGWVISSDFMPINQKLALEKGHLFTIISIIAQNNTDLAKDQNVIVGREILARLHEEYFNKIGNGFSLLNSAVRKIHETFGSPNESVQILAAVIIGNKIILAGVGQVEAWVRRNSLLAKLISSSSSASGIVQDKDEFFLGTSSFFKFVSPSSVLNKENELDSISAVIKLKIETEIESEIAQVIQKVIPKENTFPQPKKISKFRIILASLIDKILVILPTKESYVKEEFRNPEESKKKKVATTIGVILLVLLFLSILFGIKQKKSTDSKAQYQPILASIEHDLNEAESISAINPARARNLILTSKTQIESLSNKKINDKKITDLSDRIKSDLGNIAGIYQDDASLYLDLTLLNSTFKGDDIASSGERMVVLDRNGKRLETIEINSSKADPAGGPDIMPNAGLVASYADRNFVTSDNGIWEIGNKAEIVIPKDKDIGTNILVSAYAGNFYILDKDKGKVWRYQGDGGVFGTKLNWFGNGINPDLTNVISWTVDGNIWMLTKDSNILRFSGGSPVNFSLKDMDKDPAAIDIFTTQDSKYLYLLDRQNSRVLVVDKDGNYKAQYLGNNIKNASKIVVSETDKKIILLEGDKLFSLDIKHL